jgi:hypothetical protein
MEFRLTRHQVARGARADAEVDGEWFLIKRTSELHATYQIRLLAYLAAQKRRKIRIEIPKRCKIHGDLRELLRLFPKMLKVTRS